MIEPRRWSLSFRARHPRIPGEELAQRLGLKPDRSWTVGTPWTTPAGAPLRPHKLHKESYFYTRLEPESEDAELEDFLWRHSRRWERYARRLAQLTREGGEVAYYIFQDFGGCIGYCLPWRLIARLGGLHINVDVDGLASTEEQRMKWARSDARNAPGKTGGG
jgi:hypothetical protein